MYITAIEIKGMRDLPHLSLHDLDRVVRVAGPTPAATALGDGLELFFAAFSAQALERFLRRVELLQPEEAPEIIGDPHPVQASWQDRKAAEMQVTQGQRSRIVTVELRLDPPLFRTLSDQAAREPRMVAALASGGTVRITVGALLATSMDALSLTLTGFQVGDKRFATAEGERPAWLKNFLLALTHRFHRADERPAEALAQQVTELALSRDRHADFLGWQHTLADSIGLVRPALGPGGQPTLVADDLPLRRHGPVALRRARLAADAWLDPCDVLWVDDGPAWIDDAVAGDDSPLEQVFRVCADGTIDPTPAEDSPLTLRHPGRHR
ncbi:MAG: hypothetical protein GXP62_01735 [Oligoflexia bacterium]|nr:hypothetical protein [Oligoflexia bacterium]